MISLGIGLVCVKGIYGGDFKWNEKPGVWL